MAPIAETFRRPGIMSSDLFDLENLFDKRDQVREIPAGLRRIVFQSYVDGLPRDNSGYANPEYEWKIDVETSGGIELPINIIDLAPRTWEALLNRDYLKDNPLYQLKVTQAEIDRSTGVLRVGVGRIGSGDLTDFRIFAGNSKYNEGIRDSSGKCIPEDLRLALTGLGVIPDKLQKIAQREGMLFTNRSAENACLMVIPAIKLPAVGLTGLDSIADRETLVCVRLTNGFPERYDGWISNRTTPYYIEEAKRNGGFMFNPSAIRPVEVSF